MKVAIVGGGIVGRLAAWATMLTGHTPTIFDRMPEAVVPRGFVYLHDPCELPLVPHAIHVVETGGSTADYAKKIYGNADHSVSFGKFSGQKNGYEPAEALNILNGLQDQMVKNTNFKDFGEVLNLLYDYERIVITLPANQLFPDMKLSYVKGSVAVYPLNKGEVLKNFCVYSADPNIPWYRSGSMFGYAFREFATVIPGHRTIIKVMPGNAKVSTGEPKILNTGRFGNWTKQLSHESFAEVMQWLSE